MERRTIDSDDEEPRSAPDPWTVDDHCSLCGEFEAECLCRDTEGIVAQTRLVGRLVPLHTDQSALSSLPLCPCPADAPVGVFHVRAGIRHGHTFTPLDEPRPCLEPA